jgi:hypothetical protein
MCQILFFNAINTIVTDMECNIRIDRLPLGRGTDQWKMIYTSPPAQAISFPLVHTTTIGQSVYPVITYLVQIKAFLHDQYDRK